MHWLIPGPLADERIDRVIASIIDVSRSRARSAIEDGYVRLNGVPVEKASQRVDEGDRLDLDESVLETDDDHPRADPSVLIDVVHEDDALVVVDKPAGLVVHPGAGNREGTLVNGLLARYPEIAGVGDPARPGIVHRLDANTSGLMLVARQPDTYTSLVEAIGERRVDRVYRALTHGRFEHDRGSIEAPIGRSRRDPTRMTVRDDGRDATTRYEVIERYERYSLVECSLVTGRTHQIRVHLSAIGHPVVADHKYGGRPVGELARQFLHAVELSFPHPSTGVDHRFTSELPVDLASILSGLG